ncbi:MAG: PorV/PorQ family protein [Balneolaceae bacterium]
MKKYFILVIALFFASDVVGQSQDTGTGMDFLNIGPSSRILSLNEATTATPTGSSAIYTNPALLILETSSSVDLNYTLWVADVNNQFASVNLLQDSYAIGFGVYNSRSDGFQARDQPGPSQGDFSISYLSLAASAAYKIGSFSAGITAHYLREEVFQFRANGYAITTGVTGSFLDERVRIGTVLQNIGEMEELDNVSTELPTTFKAGVMANLIEFTTPGENDLPVLLSLHADYIVPLEDKPTSDFLDQNEGDNFLAVAVSADVADLFYLQTGYKWGPTERPFSFGTGVFIDPIRVNYALVPFRTGYGTSHSIGLQFYF